MNTLIIVSLAAVAAAEEMPSLIPNEDFSCWKLAYGRGVG